MGKQGPKQPARRTSGRAKRAGNRGASSDGDVIGSPTYKTLPAYQRNRQHPTHAMKGFALGLLVVLGSKQVLCAPQQEPDPWLQVLNGGGEDVDAAAEVRQVVPLPEVQQPVETQSLPQAPVRPPPRPQQFQQQPQRPLQRPPPRRPGGPRGPPRRRPPTRRPGRPTTTSKGILAGAVDAVSSAVGGVACTGSNIITDAKLRDEAFIKFQLDCAMNVGPCDEIGEKIKILAPEVLAGRCPRPCNECTKTQIKRVMAQLSQRFPRRFQEMMRQLAPKRG